jgi:hypothetical protein
MDGATMLQRGPNQANLRHASAERHGDAQRNIAGLAALALANVPDRKRILTGRFASEEEASLERGP